MLEPVPVAQKPPQQVTVRYSDDLLGFEMELSRGALLLSSVLREALDACGSGEQLALCNPRVSAHAMRLALTALDGGIRSAGDIGFGGGYGEYNAVFWGGIGSDTHTEARVVDYLYCLHWLDLLEVHLKARKGAELRVSTEYVAVARFAESLATDADDPSSSPVIDFAADFTSLSSSEYRHLVSFKLSASLPPLWRCAA